MSYRIQIKLLHTDIHPTNKSFTPGKRLLQSCPENITSGNGKLYHEFEQLPNRENYLSDQSSSLQFSAN